MLSRGWVCAPVRPSCAAPRRDPRALPEPAATRAGCADPAAHQRGAKLARSCTSAVRALVACARASGGGTGARGNPGENSGAMRPLQSRHVAVIGAGAAGLVAARELLREGHCVSVLEQGAREGGIWRYDPAQEDDPLGTSEGRALVHSSMYASLRTNLPRELMGYSDFPFSSPLPLDPEVGGGALGADTRRFPSHTEVLRYLEQFCSAFALLKHIRWNTRVLDVRLPTGPLGKEANGGGGHSSAERHGQQESCRFQITTAPATEAEAGAEESKEEYDAVMVCNGHYSQPRIAHIPGIEHWPGSQMHSHNYREPSLFRGKVVVLIGAASSGDDLSKEISHVASAVHMCSRGWTLGNVPPANLERWPNLWHHPMIVRAYENGNVEFGDGRLIRADVIFHCTGYHYSFPFLRSLSHHISIDDNRVHPLYQHVFIPALGPALSFIGLPWKVVPFPLMELQSKWVAGLLSGRIPQTSLPSVDGMMKDISQYNASLKAHGVPQDYTHCLNYPAVPLGDQFAYDDWLAAQCGCSMVQPWRISMYKKTSERKRREPWQYRDTFDDEDEAKEAHAEFEIVKKEQAQAECGRIFRGQKTEAVHP